MAQKRDIKKETMAQKQDDELKWRAITYPGWDGPDKLRAPPGFSSIWDGASANEDALENFMGSDEDRDIFCEPCEIDGQKHLAEGYCKHCAEFLCSTCYSNHRRYKPTRHHILLDKYEMPTVRSVPPVKDVCTEPCAYHENNVIEYYCRSCDRFGCSHCFVVGHRNCNVTPIRDVASDLEKTTEFKLFKDRLAKLKGQLRINGNRYHSNKSEVDIVKDRAKRDIHRQRTAINAFFDKLEKQVDNTIDQVGDDDSKVMEDAAKVYDSLAPEFQIKLSDFERKEELGQRCQLFVDMKTFGDYLQELEEKLTRSNEENQIHRYELLMSEEALSLMENLKQLAVLFKKYSVWKRKPTFGGKINVRAASDSKQCDITGVCLLNRNQLFVVDLSNTCVKLVDLTTPGKQNILCVVPMPSWPWDVTKVTSEQVVVTLPFLGQICFLSQSSNTGQMFTTRYIDVGLECRGIEYSRGNLIVSFTTDPGIVKVLTINGNVLHTFSTGQDGQPLFIEPFYLALGLDHNVIYVSDNKKHAVTSLDRAGNVKDVYENDDLRCPGGLAVDRTDSLFVCGTGYYNVHQLYSDLSQVQILLDHSNAEEKPQCIAYCSITNRIFIGMCNDNCVNMFKLM